MAAAPAAPAAPAAAETVDGTEAVLTLLRDVRRDQARARAANLAFWLYIAGLALFIYGGWLVAAVVGALRHPPPAVPDTPLLLRATPAGLCALMILIVAALLWDTLWRGPVTVARPTADWLLSTPVRRDRLLRPRYRRAAAISVLAGAAAGLVPATLLLAAGLGGPTAGHSLRLMGAGILGTALLAMLVTGVAAVAEAHASPRAIRTAIRACALAVLLLAGIAALTAAYRLPAVIGTVLLWSGPWGWAAQGLAGLAGGAAPLWPAALGLLAIAAIGTLVAGDRSAAQVPAAALRARAHTLGDMSAAVANLDARRVTTAYRGATGSYGRARLRIRPPLLRQLIVPWRDVTALLRAPARFAWSVLLSLAAVGLGALAVRSPHAALLALTGALVFGYLAAAALCEAARLDGDDPRRSAQLPIRYESLVWWHAIVPCAAMIVLVGGPAAALAVVTGHAWLLGLLAVTIPVLVGGALVNSYRGPLEGEMFAGFDTPVGNSSGVTITLWYITGPLLAIAPMIVFYNSALHTGALRANQHGHAATAVVLSAVLAAWLGFIAARRARRLRSG
jgi:hypothetical protein